MNHLLVCREYPPAPGGGIGTYSAHLAALLAQRGETVHVIGQQWKGAARPTEVLFNGRLNIHRLPHDNWATIMGRTPHPSLPAYPARALFASDFPPLAFAWQAAEHIERLVEHADIDLIEAPEYEAPLYFFLLRRALGLGPRKRPPCLIHLHSPTEWIARHNDWPLSAPAIAGAARLEAYVMTAADGLLCPSRALAEEAAAQFGPALGEIALIPLPLGPDTSPLDRSRETWASGPVAYVGRLERRKGSLEYLQAAVAVAREDPRVVFEFAGGNVLGRDPIESAAWLESLVPPSLRERFRFYGPVPPAALPGFLSRARLAVVPSHWENFPYACVEAMRSGLPVLATRTGALPHMVRDGHSGWLVERCDAAALANGLRRALAASPDERQTLGAAAAKSIRALCDNNAVLIAQLELRQKLATQGAGRSLHLPLVLPVSHQSRLRRAPRRDPEHAADGGLALLIVGEPGVVIALHCFRSILAQSEPPAAVWLTVGAPHPLPPHWQILPGPDARAAVQAVFAAQRGLSALALVPADAELPYDFVAACRRLLEHCPEVGLASGWREANRSASVLRRRTLRLAVPVCPAFPAQWSRNETTMPLLVRAEALLAAGGVPPGPLLAAAWELVNAVLEAGWVGVTYPAAWDQRPRAAEPLVELSAQAHARFAPLLQRDREALDRPAAADGASTLSRLAAYAHNPRWLALLCAWLLRRMWSTAVHLPRLWLAVATNRLPSPGSTHGHD